MAAAIELPHEKVEEGELGEGRMLSGVDIFVLDLFGMQEIWIGLG